MHTSIYNCEGEVEGNRTFKVIILLVIATKTANLFDSK